jgi:hypothetical protein
MSVNLSSSGDVALLELVWSRLEGPEAIRWRKIVGSGFKSDLRLISPGQWYAARPTAVSWTTTRRKARFLSVRLGANWAYWSGWASELSPLPVVIWLETRLMSENMLLRHSRNRMVEPHLETGREENSVSVKASTARGEELTGSTFASLPRSTHPPSSRASLKALGSTT